MRAWALIVLKVARLKDEADKEASLVRVKVTVRVS